MIISLSNQTLHTCSKGELFPVLQTHASLLSYATQIVAFGLYPFPLP